MIDLDIVRLGLVGTHPCPAMALWWAWAWARVYVTDAHAAFDTRRDRLVRHRCAADARYWRAIR